MSKLTLRQAFDSLGFKSGKDYWESPSTAFGYNLSDAAFLKFAEIVDSVNDPTAKKFVAEKTPYVKARAESKQKAANEARAKAEAKAKEEAAKRASERAAYEDRIRKKAIAANPGLSGDALERVVARLIEDDAVEAVKKAERVKADLGKGYFNFNDSL